MSTTNKSGSVIFTSELQTDNQVDQLQQIKKNFMEKENSQLREQIDDMKQTLDINKGIICDLL